MERPTYPLDRRVLEIIMALTGTTLEVHLDEGQKATSSVYKDISAQVADGAWKVKLKCNPNAKRPREFEPLHINTWKRLFGHENMDEGSIASKDTTMQIVLFLGYERWTDFEAEINEVYDRVVESKQDIQREVKNESPMSVTSVLSNFRGLQPGDEMDVYWPKSDRHDMPGEAFMKIRYLGNFGNPRFHINAVQNCSLEAGEDFDALCMEEGKMIVLTNRRLGRENKGIYTSGSEVTSVKIFRKEL